MKSHAQLKAWLQAFSLQARPSSKRPLVMGILNITPDSFFEGSRVGSIDEALYRAEKMINEGVDILDISGESSRPGATYIPLDEESRRVLPVLEALINRFEVPISVDTYKPLLMEQALSRGAAMINDIQGLASEEAKAIVAKYQVPVCIMHMQGNPQTMQVAPTYPCGVVDEVCTFLKKRVQDCLDAGITPEQIILDPGIGFGKTLEDNLLLLKGIDKLKALGYPILIGASRKKMIGDILNQPIENRLYGSLGVAAHAMAAGAAVVRVHDVLATREMLDILNSINLA